MLRDSERPSILFLTRNLPPLVGGMERLNGRFIAGLNEWADVHVIGPRGSSEHLVRSVSVDEVTPRPLARFLPIATLAALRRSSRRPDLVLAGSGLLAPSALAAARLARSRCACYVHGLDLVADSAVYRKLWLPAVRAMDLVLANSHNTAGLARSRGVRMDRLRVIHPGADLRGFQERAAGAFRASHGLGTRPFLLAVGRLTARKGLAQFVSRCLPQVLRQRPDCLLVIIGADPSDALSAAHGSGYQAIEDAAKAAGCLDALRYLGACDDDTLHAGYCAADVHVFPVLELPGDVEGFGMVAVEAAAHGLRTVAFAVGGVPDAIVDGKTGATVPSGDYHAFAAAVLAQLETSQAPGARAECEASAQRYAWSRFHREVQDSLSLLLPNAAEAPS